MTTVRELIHQLTADHIDLDARVEVVGVWGDMVELTTDFEVTFTHHANEAPVVRIEAS